jgi:hypothetical protein
VARGLTPLAYAAEVDTPLTQHVVTAGREHPSHNCMQLAAGTAKRVCPHLFRQQLITSLTRQGIISPKQQPLSGHTTQQSLAVYRELALSDMTEE